MQFNFCQAGYKFTHKKKYIYFKQKYKFQRFFIELDHRLEMLDER